MAETSTYIAAHRPDVETPHPPVPFVSLYTRGSVSIHLVLATKAMYQEGHKHQKY